jgi:putative ABC transport system permease protein
MHEIGIRMALGARSSDVLRAVLQQGLVTILIGISAGIVGVFSLSRLMEGFLFGITATDPANVSIVAALLGATALLACTIAVRKVTRVDPMVTLRSE